MVEPVDDSRNALILHLLIEMGSDASGAEEALIDLLPGVPESLQKLTARALLEMGSRDPALAEHLKRQILQEEGICYAAMGLLQLEVESEEAMRRVREALDDRDMACLLILRRLAEHPRAARPLLDEVVRWLRRPEGAPAAIPIVAALAPDEPALIPSIIRVLEFPPEQDYWQGADLDPLHERPFQMLYGHDRRMEIALAALVVLGPQAEEAVPVLFGLLRDAGEDAEARDRILQALLAVEGRTLEQRQEPR
jgi:hypothetical protein